jgi:hypothetical protein
LLPGFLIATLDAFIWLVEKPFFVENLAGRPVNNLGRFAIDRHLSGSTLLSILQVL